MAEPLIWKSASAAEDLLFVGLADALASVEAAGAREAAIIGGVMVEILVRERSLSIPRTTKDVDLGIHVVELQRAPVIAELEDRNYERREGHIFVRQCEEPPGLSSIDVLVPAYTSRQSRERRVGNLVTIEVGMLSEALATATQRAVRLVSTTATETDLQVPIPHPLAALALKLSAWEARRESKDAFDVWRCLEICAHDRLDASNWSSFPQLRDFADRAWQSHFGGLQSSGIVAALAYSQLEGDPATHRAARTVALGTRLFGSGER